MLSSGKRIRQPLFFQILRCFYKLYLLAISIAFSSRHSRSISPSTIVSGSGKERKKDTNIKKKKKQLFKGGNNGFERRQLNFSDERMRTI